MRKVIERGVWRAVRRLMGFVGLLAIMLLGTGAAIIVQGGRDETQSAPAAVVCADGDPLQVAARVDRTVELYLKGQVGYVVVIGQQPGVVQTTLENRGVPTVKLQTVQAPAQLAQIEQLQTLMVDGRPVDGLLIGEPVEMLRLLKMAHDRGLALRSVPVSNSASINISAVVDEIMHYFGYVLHHACCAPL